MDYVNQIHLIKKGVEKNRKFLKLLYKNNELSKASKWFDKLDCSISWQRQEDNDMTLEKFLKGINPTAYITLQIASPDPFDIRYCADVTPHFPKIHDAARFAWVTCPSNKRNFDIIAKLYEKSFGCCLKDEPVPEGLLEYYRQRVKSGY